MATASLRQLEVLVSVVDTGGFVAAADELGLTQSSVSHALAALERVAGGTLVERRQPVTPTPLGAAVLDHARSTLASARSFDAALARHRQSDATASCSIAVSRTAARGLLPELMKAWHRQVPGLQLNVYEGVGAELETWLTNGLVDAAVLIDPTRVPDGALPLATDILHVILHADHPLAERATLRVRDLRDQPMLSCTAGCERYIARAYERAEEPFQPAQRIRDLNTLISMVEAGVGVSIVPSLTAALAPNSLTLVPLRPVLQRHLYLSGPANRPWHPLIESLQQGTRSAFELPLKR